MSPLARVIASCTSSCGLPVLELARPATGVGCGWAGEGGGSEKPSKTTRLSISQCKELMTNDSRECASRDETLVLACSAARSVRDERELATAKSHNASLSRGDSEAVSLIADHSVEASAYCRSQENQCLLSASAASATRDGAMHCTVCLHAGPGDGGRATSHESNEAGQLDRR